jgi:hypothetical protein
LAPQGLFLVVVFPTLLCWLLVGFPKFYVFPQATFSLVLPPQSQGNHSTNPQHMPSTTSPTTASKHGTQSGPDGHRSNLRQQGPLPNYINHKMKTSKQQTQS